LLSPFLCPHEIAKLNYLSGIADFRGIEVRSYSSICSRTGRESLCSGFEVVDVAGVGVEATFGDEEDAVGEIADGGVPWSMQRSKSPDAFAGV